MTTPDITKPHFIVARIETKPYVKEQGDSEKTFVDLFELAPNLDHKARTWSGWADQIDPDSMEKGKNYRIEVVRPEGMYQGKPINYRNILKVVGEDYSGAIRNTPPSAPSQPPQGTEYEGHWKQKDGTWTQAVEWALQQTPFELAAKVPEFKQEDWIPAVEAIANEIYGLILKGPSIATPEPQETPLSEDEQAVEDMGAPREGDFNWPRCKGTLDARGITEDQIRKAVPSIKELVTENPMLNTMEITDKIEEMVKAKQGNGG